MTLHPAPDRLTRRRRLTRRAAGAWLAAALVGCAQLPRQAAEPVGPLLSGRLLVRMDASGQAAAQSWSAAFELQGSEQQGSLSLTSPLGTQLARADWGPAGVWLLTGDGRREFDDLDQLAREALGQDIPLAALTHWLHGRPWPAAAASPLADGSGFEQLGWRIDTQALSPDGRIEARRSQPAPALLVRAQLDR